MLALVLPVRFDAAHRLPEDPGPERWLHGHTFHALVRLVGDPFPDGELDPGGTAAAAIAAWVGEHLDRAVLLHPADPLTGPLEHNGQRVHRLPMGRAPTGPHLAGYLAVGVTAALVAVGLHRDLQVTRTTLDAGAHSAEWTAG